MCLAACQPFGVGSKTVTGVVTEYGSGKPIEKAIVALSYIGWGQRDDDIVWDKETVVESVTGRDGSFVASIPDLRSVRVQVSHPRYTTYSGWHDPAQPVDVKLQVDAAPAERLNKDTLQLGFEQGSPYGWNFAAASVTFNEAEADLWPVTDSSMKRFIVRAPGGGGIVQAPAAELGVTQDLLVYGDTAPDSGYVESTTLDFESVEEGPSLYFVRTRDGTHYAKFEFDPANVGLLGSDRDRQRGTWGIMLTYVHNPNGARNLTYRK